MDYTREASSRYQQVCHPVILSAFFHLLNLAAGAGPGPVQEVERSSGCDQRQELEENRGGAQTFRSDDFRALRERSK